MILYFSGTGNSRYVARELGCQLNQDVVCITSAKAETLKYSGTSLGLVFPIYSWGVPPVVHQLIKNLSDVFIEQAKKWPIWMVCTCGDETGNAPFMLEKILQSRGLQLNGEWSVIMPNNYVLLPGFGTDAKELEEEKLSKAPERIESIAKNIKEGRFIRDYVKGNWPWLKTTLVYPLFKKWGVNAKKWTVENTCVSCGRCEQVCPVKNITLEKGNPKWGMNCLSCTACFHICPVHAINYGKITRKQSQYYLPPSLDKPNLDK